MTNFIKLTAPAVIAFSAFFSGIPAEANLKSSISTFCKTGRPINAKGISLRPGSPGSKMALAYAKGVSASEYQQMWTLAKSSFMNDSNCKRLF